MRPRPKMIGTLIVLCVALGLTIFAAVQIVHAVGRFQQSRQLALSGDVRAIRPWMTLHYVSRVYRVPESYLLTTLGIADASSVRHETLYALAARLHLTPDVLIKKLQVAILTYRTQHPTPSPSGTPHSVIPPPMPAGRTHVA